MPRSRKKSAKSGATKTRRNPRKKQKKRTQKVPIAGEDVSRNRVHDHTSTKGQYEEVEIEEVEVRIEFQKYFKYFEIF